MCDIDFTDSDDHLVIEMVRQNSVHCPKEIDWNQGPISSIKFARYILNCAYVVF